MRGAERPQVRFDDIDGLRRNCGPEFGPFGPSHVVTQAMVNDFAELSGDHQWIHTDVARARADSPFKGTIAQGLLVLSMMSRLRMPLPVDIVGHQHMLHVGSDRLRFIRPVPVGSTVHGRARLAEAQATDRGTRTVAELNIHIEGHHTPAVMYSIITLYQ